jgi:hypothetical protein
LQEFYAMLGADSSRAFYGPGHVLAAAELGAIQTLLISGALVGASFMTASCCFARMGTALQQQHEEVHANIASWCCPVTARRCGWLPLHVPLQHWQHCHGNVPAHAAGSVLVFISRREQMLRRTGFHCCLPSLL